MSAEGPSDRAQFLTTSAAVAASAVMLPLAAVADEEARAVSTLVCFLSRIGRAIRLTNERRLSRDNKLAYVRVCALVLVVYLLFLTGFWWISEPHLNTAVPLFPFVLLATHGKQTGSTQVKLVTTKLGGKLEPFADVSKGYRLAKPLGWNRYDGTSGEYTVKMVDLVDPTTLILLTNSPVKSDTEVCRVSDFEDAVRLCVSVRHQAGLCSSRPTPN